MQQFHLKLRLLEDTVFTSRSATAGAQETLDHIPGATLYGACAGRLYANLAVSDQFDVFHSGKVRFGNGLPCDSVGNAALPMPYCWHVQKGLDYRDKDNERALERENIVNSAVSDPVHGIQLKQLRKGYVNDAGELSQPATTFRMKTAINPTSHTAAEAQLYGYSAIRAGQTFLATLEVDTGDSEGAVSKGLAVKVVQSLSGRLRLGRSRSSQYGTVECEVYEVDSRQAKAVNCNEGLRLWLLSDVALRDDFGQATLIASARNLGLPEQLQIDWSKTFVRTRNYSPYNAKRRCHDQERQVLAQGSVISFKPDNSQLSPHDVASLQRGVGDYLHTGLGQVMVQPTLLGYSPPRFSKSLDSQNTGSRPFSETDKPNTALVTWLEVMVKSGQKGADARQAALTLHADLRKLYHSAWGYAAAVNNELRGPGKSQWGRVLAVAKTLTQSEVHMELTSITGQTCVGDVETYADPDWATETGQPGNDQTFGRWLVATFGQNGQYDMEVLQLVASYAMDLVDELERGRGSSNQKSEVEAS